jgi:hypothetical protein
MTTDIRKMASSLMAVDHVGEAKHGGIMALEAGAVGLLLGTLAKSRKGGLSGPGGHQMDLVGGAAGLLLAPYLTKLPVIGDFVTHHERRIQNLSQIAFGIGVYNQTVRGGGAKLLAHGDAEAAVLEAAGRL